MPTKTKIITGLFLLSFFFLTNVQAQSVSAPSDISLPPPPTDAQRKAAQEKTVATVDLYNAKIINQNKNEIEISFDLNNRLGIQPQIKYALLLIQEEEGKQSLIERKVYDEVVTLGENELVNKKITYIAPDFLTGNYKIYLEVRNEVGLFLRLNFIDEVKLESSDQGVSIDYSSCYLTIENDAEQKKYTLEQGVDIKTEENLLAHCVVESSYLDKITVTPNFATYFRTVFGKKLDEKNLESITLEPNQKTEQVFTIPKQTNPQAYDAVLFFTDKQKQIISNSIIFHYVIQGPSATIQNVILDKTAYQKGETAKLSFFYTRSASDSPNSRAGLTDLGDLTLNIQLKDGNGQVCTSVKEEMLVINKEEEMQRLKTELAIEKDCNNPQAEITIQDSSEKVLAKNTLSFAGKEDKEKQGIKADQNQDKKSNYAKFGLFILLVLIPLGILAGYFIKKKLDARKIIIPLLFLVFIGTGIFMGGEAKAESPVSFSPSLNKYSFAPGETIAVTGQGSCYCGGCGNWCGCYNYNIYFVINGQGYNLPHPSFSWGEVPYGPTYVVAPMVPGSYNVDFYEYVLLYDWQSDTSWWEWRYYTSLSFVVTCTNSTWSPDPSTYCSGTTFTQTSNCGATRSAVGTQICFANGECGPGDGKKYPNKSLIPTPYCIYPTTQPAISGTGPWTWTCAGIGGGVTDNCSADICTSNPQCVYATEPSCDGKCGQTLEYSGVCVDLGGCVGPPVCSSGCPSKNKTCKPCLKVDSYKEVSP